MIENRLKLIAEQLILSGASEVVLRVEESIKTALSEEVGKTTLLGVQHLSTTSCLTCRLTK